MSQTYLSQKLQNMTESATLQMAQKARELRNQGIDVISLSLGEPDFDTPEYIKEAAKKALDDGYTKYPPVSGFKELRDAICNKFKRDNDLDYDVNQIVVSNGAKQCIANTCLALLDEGDDVLIFTPYWVSYFHIVKFAGGNPIPLYAGIDEDYKVNPQQLENALTDKTKMIIFSSPSNPTGSVYSHEELKNLAAVISNREGLFVIADEIYEYINFHNKNTSIAKFDGMMDKTITINGMSKGFAMTGWRLGYMAAPLWIAQACTKVQGQFTSGANSFGQMAAALALSKDPSDQDYMKDKYEERKMLVKKMLDDIDGIKTNNPEGAFYFFPNISDFFGRSNGSRTINNADDFVDVLLDEAHVAAVSGSAFGDRNSFRISYATSNALLTEALSRMKKVLDSYK
ncbi:MAG: pyridoxal phosphate-dependent aminotransferase [Saprospiraceae bacterium]|nr:pyridoxal phosphate-dependent aminotransferase [Bacteroidia bacterium]NNE13910.1 pyridoxal phosphate-dependent aminotransferase [Saprospiraceae bacterium]NNL91285.1 pyridoxal phosphate-dependent aminotransferase [Saprospiraceae bacterium]